MDHLSTTENDDVRRDDKPEKNKTESNEEETELNSNEKEDDKLEEEAEMNDNNNENNHKLLEAEINDDDEKIKELESGMKTDKVEQEIEPETNIQMKNQEVGRKDDDKIKIEEEEKLFLEIDETDFKENEKTEQEEIIKVEVQMTDVHHDDKGERKVGFVIPRQSLEEIIIDDKDTVSYKELDREFQLSKSKLDKSFSWSFRSEKDLEHADVGKIDVIGIKPKIMVEMLLERKQRPQYENSYQIDIPYKFEVEKVTAILEKHLTTSLSGQTYECNVACKKAKKISHDILIEVKSLKYIRHKIISVVTVGQKADQSLHMINGNLWNTNFDNFATYKFENHNLFAVAAVFALHYE
ncbi:suppressor of Mek1-like [Centruroides sculpturatus]|uniref:suppressor of Mek1-like n=1 Tax=Centruroides sculpturatus TaxID=218467 RepID=UPI000C6E6895|nr:suppressor of Mek1-like [Centruroides sculpturatus]